MKGFAIILVRIFSLYYLIRTVSSVTSLVAYLPVMMNIEAELGGNGIVPLVAVAIVNLAICIALWIFSTKIGEFIAPSDIVPDEKRHELDYNLLLKIAIKVVGMIIIILSFEEAVRGAFSIIGLNLDRFDMVQRSVLLLDFFFPIIKIMMGYILISSNKIHKMIGAEQL